MELQKTLIYRIGWGKALGLVFGLIGFICLPLFINDPAMTLRFGVLLWYPTMGAFIGIFGVFSAHPILKFSMPWWFRGALIGGWLNFVLTLIAFEQICILLTAMFGEYSRFASPYWMIFEGAIIGMMMDYVLTRYFGEGNLSN